MVALHEIEWSDKPLITPLTDSALEKLCKKETGMVPSAFSYFTPLPWLAKLNIALYSYPQTHISYDLACLVYFVVAQDHSCRYCYGVMRSLLKIYGYSEYQIRKMEEDIHLSDLGKKEKLALDFAKKFSHCDPRPGRSEIEGMQKAGFSKADIVELAFLAAVACMGPRANTFSSIPPDPVEKIEKNIMVRILRPAVAWLFKRYTKYRKPEPFPTENSGPYGELVTSLKEVPTAAATLRNTIDELFASDIISKRAKLLSIAVIAKTAGCPKIEQDTRKLLLREGLSEADNEDILTHLASEKLDPLESQMVPLARETVRYKPIQIQKRIREIATNRSDPETLEIIGTMMVGNCISRLTVLMENC